MSQALTQTPLTADLTRWYAWQSIASGLLIVALAAYGFWANLGGRALFREEDGS